MNENVEQTFLFARLAATVEVIFAELNSFHSKFVVHFHY